VSFHLHVHSGDGFGSYWVTVRCDKPHPKIVKACRNPEYGEVLPNGACRVAVAVFAGSKEQAPAAAVDKITDKWWRHQNIDSVWTAETVSE